MTRIVINCRYGGFSLSREAFLLLRELGSIVALAESDVGEEWSPTFREVRTATSNSFCQGIGRTDPLLIQVIEKIGATETSGPHCQLKIVDIPDDVEWEITEYGGKEHIQEKGRQWE